MSPTHSMPAPNPCLGDAEAFCALVRDHAGMVFATARRITGDAALAEDVTQETFLALARQRHTKVDSIGAWLHRVAWRKANNAVRGEVRRRRHEEAAAELLDASDEARWKDVKPLIDEILEELPAELREPLVEHFLEGRTQQEIAGRKGLSQATISRQLDTGLGELRSRLRTRGVLCGTGLATLLGARSVEAAPANLTTSLGKLALSGVGSSASSVTSMATTFLLFMNLAKVTLSVVAVSALIGVPVLLHQHQAAPLHTTENKTVPAPVAATLSKPTAHPASAKIYRPPPMPENVRFKVEAIIRRHKGMTKEELAKDPEFAELGNRFAAALDSPEAKARLEKAIQKIRDSTDNEHGVLQLNLSGDGDMDTPLGRSWLEAVLSDDPQLAQDWAINKLEGASFEFAVDPTLETSSEGVRVTPDTHGAKDAQAAARQRQTR